MYQNFNQYILVISNCQWKLTITLRCCFCLFFPQVFPFVFIFALKKAHTLISETKYAQAYLTVNAPVTFLKEPEDSRMTEGEFAEFYCAVSGKPKPKVEWTLNGRAIKENESSAFRYEFYQDSQLLKINDLKQNADAGLYSCAASNGVGKVEVRSARLVIDKASGPYFQIKQHNMSVFEYDSSTLECK